MATIADVITFGVGPGGDIPTFLTGGLGIGAAIVAVPGRVVGSDALRGGVGVTDALRGGAGVTDALRGGVAVGDSDNG